jgi:NADP-dependent 3-hydroxy acid dehydrogenase YdfG
MPRRLSDCAVVVTGTASGIGRATALAFAKKGAAVVVVARREDALHEVAEQCRQRGAMAMAVPADMSDEAAVERVAQAPFPGGRCCFL